MTKEEQMINNRLQGLAEKMKRLGYQEHWIRLTVEYVNELQEKGALGVDRLVKRLERCTRSDDKREYWDVLIEGRLAVLLVRNGFSKIHIEYSDSGPDIKADYNRRTIYFEVTRKRSLENEWAKEQEDTRFPSGDLEDIISKIQGKLKQLKDDEINIVVLCSSTIAVDEHDIREAFKLIEKDPKEYEKLSGILFTNDWGINIPKMTQFYLFRNENASKPIGPRLTKKLKSLREQDIKQFQREHQGLFTMFKRQGGQ